MSLTSMLERTINESSESAIIIPDTSVMIGPFVSSFNRKNMLLLNDVLNFYHYFLPDMLSRRQIVAHPKVIDEFRNRIERESIITNKPFFRYFGREVIETLYDFLDWMGSYEKSEEFYKSIDNEYYELLMENALEQNKKRKKNNKIGSYVDLSQVCFGLSLARECSTSDIIGISFDSDLYHISQRLKRLEHIGITNSNYYMHHICRGKSGNIYSKVVSI